MSNNNRPNNHFIKDADSPYTFTYLQNGVLKSITVHQSAKEETWPGGALWDIGVLMAKLLVMMQSPSSCHTSSPTTNNNNPLSKKQLFPHPPKRLLSSNIWGPTTHFSQKRILELGCGVGLTGLVASALGARAVIVSDLQEVVEQITVPNVALFQKQWKEINHKKIQAKTLCWGQSEDEEIAKVCLDAMAPPYIPIETPTNTTKRKKKGRSNKTKQTSKSNRNGIPDIILIGDVAYQHKPGSKSHFDILHSTLMNLVDESTLVIFGTRMRMPASLDLLELFREELEELVDPPVEAHEIDPAFDRMSMGGRKHNITIHIMRKKKKIMKREEEDGIPNSS